MKKVIVRESTKAKTESSLKAKGVDVTVLWNTAYVADSGNTRLQVQCNVCSNTEDCSLSAISVGRYVCTNCRDISYKNACEKLNLNLVEKVCEDGKHLLVTECKSCGEHRRTNSGHILRGLFKCNGCLIVKYTDLCNRLNLKFISKAYLQNLTKISAVCNICGEHTVIASSELVAGKFRCGGCQLNKYKSELKKKNCSLINIEKREGKKSLIHYVNSHGHKFSAIAGSIAQGEFEASINGRWSHPNSTYLIKLQTGCESFICKIGTANDPHRRAKNLKLNKHYVIFVLDSFETRNGADRLESELHKEFAEYRLCKNVAAEHTGGYRSQKDSSGKYHRVKDGITEWFSSEVFDILSQRYNLE